jgi:hypothetical protein
VAYGTVFVTSNSPDGSVDGVAVGGRSVDVGVGAISVGVGSNVGTPGLEVGLRVGCPLRVGGFCESQATRSRHSAAIASRLPLDFTG